jgi:acyl-CoA thioester hydrolase
MQDAFEQWRRSAGLPDHSIWCGQVRDYEVDSFGGVNAATYLNWMEEARKHYLNAIGINIQELFKKNIGFVVGRYEIDYLRSLIGGDYFVVQTTMDRVSRLKVQFLQNIYRMSDMAPSVRCKNVGIPIDVAANKACWPPLLDEILAGFPIVNVGHEKG